MERKCSVEFFFHFVYFFLRPLSISSRSFYDLHSIKTYTKNAAFLLRYEIHIHSSLTPERVTLSHARRDSQHMREESNVR